jgi:hypothetical protein
MSDFLNKVFSNQWNPMPGSEFNKFFNKPVVNNLTSTSDPALESKTQQDWRALERASYNTTTPTTNKTSLPAVQTPAPSQFVPNNNDISLAPARNLAKQMIGPGSNVLSNYRSYTYNFTLAALRSDWVNKPENYKTSLENYVIIKSGGKGAAGITGKEIQTVTSEQTAANAALATDRATSVQAISASQRNIDRINAIPGIISGFNKNSPGRFDLFIDNMEIETIMSFNPDGGATLPVRFKFEVYEPYSINGFIEALQVSAVAAGYASYASASFVLKVDFIGYPDGDGMPDSQQISHSERYFPISFTGMEIEVTEQGTRYSCAAVPFNDKMLGLPNKLRQPVTPKGTNVRQIVTDLLNTVNEQIERSDRESGITGVEHDTYSVKFMNWDNELGFVEAPEDTKHIIADAPLSIKNSSDNNDQTPMADTGDSSLQTAYKGPGGSSGSSTAPTPDDNRLTSFKNGQQIHECISNIIRDSEYLKSRLKNISSNIDLFGMFEYFIIKPQIENKDKINPQTGSYFQNFTYLVSPYKIYYKRVPGYQTNKNTESEQHLLNSASIREYNYIYTGKNIDVLGFKINFNNLYFSSIPYALGKTEFSSGKFSNNSVRKSSSTPTSLSGSNTLTKPSDNLNPVPSSRSTPTSANTVPLEGSGLPPQYDEFSLLARNLHSAVVNSYTDMIRGEISILGDPVFLVTGGMNGENLKPLARGLTAFEQANHMYGQVNININFRNPVDINSFENGGTLYFDSNKAAFSGVYMVKGVVSSFRDGKFIQRIEVIRIPNQYDDDAKSAPTTSTIQSVFVPDIPLNVG